MHAKQEIPTCTLRGLDVLSRSSRNGKVEHYVIMTFQDATQTPDFLNDDGYQSLAGPFLSYPEAGEIKDALAQRISKKGLDNVVEEVISGKLEG